MPIKIKTPSQGIDLFLAGMHMVDFDALDFILALDLCDNRIELQFQI